MRALSFLLSYIEGEVLMKELLYFIYGFIAGATIVTIIVIGILLITH